MTPPAVVIAAGLGTRLRPLTERYAKPVLPVEGKPVIARLLRELETSGCPAVTIVTGHLGAQIERLIGDGRGYAFELRWARQESADGSADAVVAARPEAPYLVAGADQVFQQGEIGRFAAAFEATDAAGAVAVRQGPGTVRMRNGLVEQFLDEGVAAGPLWAVGPALAPHVEALPGKKPFELITAFQQAIDAGERVVGIEIGSTHDLTTPFDLLEHNFPYLGQL